MTNYQITGGAEIVILTETIQHNTFEQIRQLLLHKQHNTILHTCVTNYSIIKAYSYLTFFTMPPKLNVSATIVTTSTTH